MNDNARALVVALRSGDFPQTTGTLHFVEGNPHRPAGYCCLGVACEIYDRAHPEAPLQREVADGLAGRREAYDGEVCFLPERVREWLGFRTNNGAYDGASLWVRNDTGATFAEIADLIESEPPGLFVEAEGGS